MKLERENSNIVRLCRAPFKYFDVGHDILHDVFDGVRIHGFQQIREPLIRKHITLGIHRLGNSVGIEEKDVAWVHFHAVFTVDHPLQYSDDRAMPFVEAD